MKLSACVLSAVLLAACGSEDVLVFDAVPAAGGSGGADGDLTSSVGGSNGDVTTTLTGTSSVATTTGSATEPCNDTTDCGYYYFCRKDACAATVGTCEAQPANCDPNPDPVCGCDGVTYWNDCMRRQVGVAASTPGECSAYARRCYSATDCSVFGFCARLLPHGESCGPEPYPAPEGTCWAVPPRQRFEDDSIFLLCPGGSMPAPEHCVHTHWAVTSQLLHIRIDDVADCPNGALEPGEE